jgi:class 3 adenylate cyclase
VDERPVTTYAKTPDGVSIAYQVAGDGPLDLVFLSGFGIPVDLMWEEPGFVRFAKRLSGFSRTVWLEGRAMGASGGHPTDTLEDDHVLDADLTAVLDAIGSEPAVLIGTSNGAPMGIRYAAGYPERVRALVLINTYAHYVRGDDYPWGFSPEVLDRFSTSSNELWGTGAWLDTVAPSKTRDEAFRAWWARCERLGVGPDQVAAMTRLAWERDVRRMLPTLTVPTLVVHREGDHYIRVGAGRYLAEHIPGAKYVELWGDDHLFFVGDTDALLDQIEEFLTGTHQAAEGDVVTATILFTDIVSSTEQSARMGHRKWSAVTHDHDAMVRATLQRHRGREVKTMGDGFLATFDATTRAVRAAKDIVAAATGIGIDVRAGVHTGEVEVRPDDVVGLAVTIAKRICDLAGPGQVLVSETVKGHLFGSGITLFEEGTHVLKGVPDQWRLFAVGG